MSSIDYQERIPNNVDLSTDRRLQRALEKWQPAFLDWWNEMGPEGLTRPRRVPAHGGLHRPGGWANFGYVKMPEYRWGIFLDAPEEGRVIPVRRPRR
jgi:benzoyl-CoA 2,3-dioxygenase component B